MLFPFVCVTIYLMFYYLTDPLHCALPITTNVTDPSSFYNEVTNTWREERLLFTRIIFVVHNELALRVGMHVFISMRDRQ